MKRFLLSFLCFLHPIILLANGNNKITVPLIDTVAQAINTQPRADKISPIEELKALKRNQAITNNNLDISYNQGQEDPFNDTELQYNILQNEITQEQPIRYSYKTTIGDNLNAIIERLESLNQKSASLFFRDNKLKSWRQELADIIYYLRIMNKKEHHKRLEQEPYKRLLSTLKELARDLSNYEPLIQISDITKEAEESPYTLLGVDSDATDQEIEVAYKTFYEQYAPENIEQRMRSEGAQEKDIKRAKKSGAIVLATIKPAYESIKTAEARTLYARNKAQEHSDQLSAESNQALQKITAILGKLLYNEQLLSQIERFIKEYEPQELEKKKTLTKSELERIEEEKIRLQQRPYTSPSIQQPYDYGSYSGGDYYGDDYGNYGGGYYGGSDYDGGSYSLPSQPVSSSSLSSTSGPKGSGGPATSTSQSGKEPEKKDIKDKKEEAPKPASKDKKDMIELFNEIKDIHQDLETAFEDLQEANKEKSSEKTTQQKTAESSLLMPPPPPAPIKAKKIDTTITSEPLSEAREEKSTSIEDDQEGATATGEKKINTGPRKASPDEEKTLPKQPDDIKTTTQKLINSYKKIAVKIDSAIQADTQNATIAIFNKKDINDFQRYMYKLQPVGKKAINTLMSMPNKKQARNLEEAINQARKSLKMTPINEEKKDKKQRGQNIL